MLRIGDSLAIPLSEIEIEQIRASGPGGQHVNKVASAVHLRFDIGRSSLPPQLKARLLRERDRRITADGIIVIKARQYRSYEKNREDGLARLGALIARCLKPAKKRLPTAPTRASQRRRLAAKQRRGRQKSLRGKVRTEE